MSHITQLTQSVTPTSLSKMTTTTLQKQTAGQTVMSLMLICCVAGCVQKPFPDSRGHLSEPKESLSATIPAPVVPVPQPLKTINRIEPLLNISVHDVPVNELLFALARDAKVNIDIGKGITGTVSLNAIDQTLSQILERLKRQVSLRYKLIDGTLVVASDNPYFVQYSIPYLNLTRSSEGETSIATQVASTGAGATSDSGTGAASSNSATKVKSISIHMFWETLLDNLRAMLREQDSMPSHAAGQAQQAPVSQSATEALSSTIIANQETGVIAIKADEKQHEELRRYINNVVEHASRQVLIEATIIEVELKDDYQAGIDWSVVANDGKFTFNQNLQNIISSAANTSPATMLAYKGSEILAAVKVLDTFGNARVLSSPKLMVLNNQTAILKVVDNHVYFTTTAQQSQSVQGSVLSTIETELHTVPVGLVMSVTPQINQNDQVIIHARPTVSRIASEVRDPNPLLEDVPSLIPVIQVREMESILKVNSGEIGVLGGLMENAINNESSGTPGLNKVAYLDNLFSFKTSKTRKTELVVFLRPRVIKNASLKGELNDFSDYLIDAPVKFAVPEFK